MSIICHWIKNLSISRLSLDNRFCNTFIFTYSSCSRGQPGRSADSDHVIFVTCWILVKITIRFYQRNWKIPFRTSNVEVIGKNRRDEYMWSLCTFFKWQSEFSEFFWKFLIFRKFLKWLKNNPSCSSVRISSLDGESGLKLIPFRPARLAMASDARSSSSVILSIISSSI